MLSRMPVREAPDRRGRAERGSAGLLERGPALHAIDAALKDTQRGVSHTLLVEGHAGMGKSRLHEAALDQARTRDMRVLRAAGAELERNFAFGVARQLLGDVLAEIDPDHTGAPIAETSEALRALAGVGGTSAEAGDAGLLHHELFELITRSEPGRPVLL